MALAANARGSGVMAPGMAASSSQFHNKKSTSTI
jgi:hypothetical protein